MKHLKRWKLFESDKYESFIRDIEDLSLELSDLGMEVKVWSEINTERITPIPNSYKESIQVNIKRFPNGLLNIKEFIERSLYILSDFSVKCFGSSSFEVYEFDYNNIKDENTIIRNLGEYYDVDFHEIYVRFYKPEDVYHIVIYDIGPYSGWRLVDVNIKTKEEANKILNDRPPYFKEHSLIVVTDKEYWNALGDQKYFRENKRRSKPIEEGLKYSNVIDDLNDILLDASDIDDYHTKVDYYSNNSNQIIQIDTSIYTIKSGLYINLELINDCIERIIDYIKSSKMFYNPTAHISYENEDLEIKTRLVGWKQLDYTHQSSDEIKNLNIIGVKLKFGIKTSTYRD